MRNIKTVIFFMFSIASLDVNATGPAVTACGVIEGKAVRYTYVINNYDALPVSKIIIGIEDSIYSDDGYSQLHEYPTGMDTDTLSIPKSSYTSPVGWQAEGFAIEADDSITPDKISVVFKIWDSTGKAAGSPVQASSGRITLSILVDKPDPKYLTGSVRLFPLRTFDKEPYVFQPVVPYTVPITMIDKTEPVIKVAINPSSLTPPTLLMVPIIADISVIDDCDPQPQVVLKSISDNQFQSSGLGLPVSKINIEGASIGSDSRSFKLRASPLSEVGSAEHVYTIEYTATDLSNRTSRSISKVTVPTVRKL